MTYQANGTTLINTSRVFTNLTGVSTNVSDLGNQVGSSTTNLNLNTGNCFLINFTTDHTSTKTLTFTNVPSQSLEAVIFVTSSTGSSSTPGSLIINASGWTVRTTDGVNFEKPINNQQDAYAVWFFGITNEMYVTYAMKDIK